MREDELIDKCVRELKVHDRVIVGSGDDCAVLSHLDGKSVISTDTLVEGTHFRRDWSTAREVGVRAAVQNMADIAAMGAVQHCAVVAVTIPDVSDQDWVVQLASGFQSVYEAAGGAVVGGDITRGDQLVITVTVIGDLQGRVPILRSGAQVGDAILLAGQQGWSAAGLALLLSGKIPGCVRTAAELVDRGMGRELAVLIERAITAYRTPQSPLSAGVEAGRLGAHAMMDVSDGLTRDLGKMCRASGVNAALDPIAVAQFLDQLAPLSVLGVDVRNCFFNGGEDHPMLATCAAEDVAAMVAAGFKQIGNIESADDGAVGMICMGGEQLVSAGFDHFVINDQVL